MPIAQIPWLIKINNFYFDPFLAGFSVLIIYLIVRIKKEAESDSPYNMLRDIRNKLDNIIE